MATTDRSTDATSALELESAGFVRVIARRDGDALAASGVLARALADAAIPFQVSVASTVQERTARATGGAEPREDELTLVVGSSEASSDRVEHLETDDRPVSLLACEHARELGAEPDPVLALAGSFAAGVEPGAGETEWLLESATDRGLLTQRGGVATPTDDLADALAHTTACRGPWSGDLEAAREAIDALEATDDSDGIDPRRFASLLALDVVGCANATTRGATAVGRLLRPYGTPEGPFETLGGYADVLEATARDAPGIGVALAMGTGGDRTLEAALECWREHGLRTHEAFDTASTRRYDGLFVVSVDGEAAVDTGPDAYDGTLETVARLTADYRSPEPVVLAIGSAQAAIATLDGRSLETDLETIARDLESEGTLEAGVDYDVGVSGGIVRFGSESFGDGGDGERGGGDESTIIAAVRRAL